MFISSRFIVSYGIALVVLSTYRIIGFTELNSKFFFSISLTGFFFILFDFTKYFEEKMNKKFLKYTLSGLSEISLNAAAYAIVFVPVIQYDAEKYKSIIGKINDVVGLAGLGLVIILIGIKSRHETIEKFQKYDDLLQKYDKLIDDFESDVKKVRTTIDEILSDLKNGSLENRGNNKTVIEIKAETTKDE